LIGITAPGNRGATSEVCKFDGFGPSSFFKGVGGREVLLTTALPYQQSKFKRLKRGKDREQQQTPQGIDDMFNSDDEEEAQAPQYGHGRSGRRGGYDEMEGFIEEDTFSDEEGQREQDDMDIAPPARPSMPGLGATEAAGLDENALEDMRAAFGDGTEYRFALDIEDQEDDEKEDESRRLDLKDVFEPSELAERS
jgi:hypothetical protein